MTLTLTLNNSYKLDLDTYSFWRQRSGTGAQNYSLSVNGVGVGTGSVPSSGSATGALAPTTTSFGGTSGLSTYTFVLGLSGASGSGTFRVDDFSLLGAFTLANLVQSYWDTNGVNAGVGGSGTWSSGDTKFSSSTGGTDPAGRASIDPVIFAGTAGTVTVNGAVQAQGGITFATDGYTLASGTIGLGATNSITTNTGVNATIGSSLTGTSGMTKLGTGNLTLTGASSYTGGTTISGGTLTLGNGGAILGNVANNSVFSFDRSDTFTFAGDISGSGNLVQTGSGTSILSGSNTYAGTTTIAGGTLQVGNGGTSGTLGTGAVTNNSALSFNRSDSMTVANSIGGSGSVSQIGSGTTILTGSNSYGATTVVAGTLQIGDGGTSGTLGAGAVTNNSALSFNRSDSMTVANAISGSGTVSQIGSGTTILTGSNSYGATTIAAGTLQIGDGGTSGTLGSGAVTNDSALVINRSDDVTISNNIGGSGTMDFIGGNKTTLSGDNSYAGGTTVTSGSVVANSDTALGTGEVSLTGTSLLAGNGVTVSNDLNLNAAPGGSVVVANWNFNNYDGSDTPISANGGTSSATASIDLSSFTGDLGNFGGSTINALNGDLDGASLSLINQTGNGSFIGISGLDFSGLSNAEISFASQGTGTGFNSGQWAYSTDGSSFTDFGADTSSRNSFALAETGTTSGLDGIGSGFLTYTLDGASSSGGNNRIDNLQVTALQQGAFATVGSDVVGGTATFSGNGVITGGANLTAALDGTVEFSGDLSGGGAVNKTGLGTVELTGTNTYTGDTTVSAGTLIVGVGVDSLAEITSDVTVADGATLGGTGTITGDVSIADNGTLAVGNSPGLMTVTGASTFASGSIFEWELGDYVSSGVDTRGVIYDALDSDSVTVESGAIFRILLSGTDDLENAFWTQAQDWTDIFEREWLHKRHHDRSLRYVRSIQQLRQ